MDTSSLGGEVITDAERTVLNLLQDQLDHNVKITNEKRKQAGLEKLEAIRAAAKTGAGAGATGFAAAATSPAGNISQVLRAGAEQIALVKQSESQAKKVIQDSTKEALLQGSALESATVSNDAIAMEEASKKLATAQSEIAYANQILKQVPNDVLAAQGAAIGGLFEELGKQMQELGPEGKIGGILAISIGSSFANITANIGLLQEGAEHAMSNTCLLYTSPSPRDRG